MSKFDKTKFLASIQKKEDAAKALLTDEERDELACREAGAARLAQVKADERAARCLHLARRLEDAQERHPELQLRPLEIQEFDDTFIVQRDGAAHAVFEKSLVKAGTKETDQSAAKLEYAMAVVYDWNGISDWAPTNENGIKLRDFFVTNSAVVTPIVNLALALNGAFAVERKS